MMTFLNKKPLYDITFICRRDKDYFAQQILRELKKKYSIQYLYPEHKRDYSHRQIRGNVIWVEWAHKFAHLVSKKKWKQKKVFVRLHRYEIETLYMEKIRWKNINKLIFVNQDFEKLFKQRVNNSVETITIPNAVFIDDLEYNPPQNRKNICAFSISFNQVKGYLELLTFFWKLIKKDKKYKLNILARHPQNETESNYLHEIETKIEVLSLEKFVTITRSTPERNLINDRKNISDFLLQQDIIISFSKLESFHYSFAEGLLCGLQGFYNAWKNPFIKDFWGKWGYDSEREMIDAIIQWSRLPLKEKRIATEKNREYVIKNFRSDIIGKKYEKEFFD